MSYIEKEPIIEFITNGLNNPDKTKAFGYDAIEILTEIEYAPTADVVPKSEIVNILDGLMKEAREIADRYEKSANETSDYDYARIEYRGCQMGALLVLFKIAELKKKYAEGE